MDTGGTGSDSLPSGAIGPDPGPVDATPIFAFTGGSLAVGPPLQVASVSAPGDASVAFGSATFTGPTQVFLAAAPAPAIDPDTADLYLNAFAVQGGAQTDLLLVSDADGTLRLKAGPTGARVYGNLTVDGTLYGPSGSVYSQAGPTGATGREGVAGPTGAQGSAGSQGAQGVAGPTGPQGPQGSQGSQGAQGVAGPTGAQGSAGSQGAQGVAGPTGPQGPQGSQGSQGVQGSTGPTGQQGLQGAQGIQGIQGATGPTGAQGAQGSQGVQGLQGPTGAQGGAGSQGAQGVTGPTGPQGVAGGNGADGATGPTGVGPTGATWRPWVCLRLNGGVTTNLGTVTAAVGTGGVGVYDISWSTAHPNGSNYAILGMCRNANGAMNYTLSAQSSTTLRVTTYGLTGAQVSSDFNLMTYP